MKLTPFFALLPSLVAICSAIPQNHRIPVRLIIEAPGNVIFKGTVLTKGHDVTTATGGTHKCDGTNNGAHPHPGATPTSALADAAERAGFTFDGQWFPSFEDFFITEIGGVTGTCDWFIKKNSVAIEVGGCQEQLSPGDRVSFTCVPH